MTDHCRTMAINGIQMNVLIRGQGPDVLLLHGFPDTHEIWRYQIDALVEAGFRVIAPDLRGYGKTDMMPRVQDYHIDHLVADVIALLDELKIDKVMMAGHDWGAVLGWFVALRHGNRVSKYAALSVGHPTAYATAGWKQKLLAYYTVMFQLRGAVEWLLSRNNFTMLLVFTKCAIEIENWRNSLREPGRLTAGLNWYRANLALVLPTDHGKATMPVMGVYSTQDVALVEEQMLNSEKFCTGGWRYEKLDGVGHWMSSEAPKKVNALLLDFFS